MSLRTRLLVFLIGIVVVPTLAVAGVLFLVVSRQERGEADVRLAGAQRAAVGLYQDYRGRAATAGGLIAADPRFAAALRARDRVALEARLRALARRARAVRAQLELPGEDPLDVGARDAVAPAVTRLLDADRGAATLTVSVLTARDYAQLLAQVTGVEAGIWGSQGALATTLEQVPRRPPREGEETTLAGRGYAVAGFASPGFERGGHEVRVLEDVAAASAGLGRVVLIVGLGLLGFLVLAFVFWWSVVRALREETGRLLEATRRIARGDLGVEMAEEGDDEFASLGRQFNDMSRQLEGRMVELQRERARLQSAIRRVGESLARGLDRSALLETVVQTAVDGAGATGGRATMRAANNGHFDEVASAGALEGTRAAIAAAERAALHDRGLAEVDVEGTSALAQAMRAREGDERVFGLIAIARPGLPFSAAERELFDYLSSQASVSVENVDLHEAVQRQAVTDDLTGLFNHRHFQERVASEVERARRFGTQVSLVLVDIDDFKQVNDTHGHLQGDEVLRAVARVLRESAREIDEPARYGGEELAIVLPSTDLEGGVRFAERLRGRIAALEVPLVGQPGTVAITVSCGVAALGRDGAHDKTSLVAAADAALYEAKRAGKNRTVEAQ